MKFPYRGGQGSGITASSRPAWSVMSSRPTKQKTAKTLKWKQIRTKNQYTVSMKRKMNRNDNFAVELVTKENLNEIRAEKEILQQTPVSGLQIRKS